MGIRDERFWAGFLGVMPSDWDVPGVSIRPHSGLAGYKGVWCFRCREHTVISAPAGWVAPLERKHRGSHGTPDRPRTVVQRALHAGKLLLYQTLEANSGAVRIALRLGYEQYARHLAVRLRNESPMGDSS